MRDECDVSNGVPVDARVEIIPMSPLLKGPAFRAWVRECRLHVPASEGRAHRLLIAAEELDIEIIMVSRLAT